MRKQTEVPEACDSVNSSMLNLGMFFELCFHFCNLILEWSIIWDYRFVTETLLHLSPSFECSKEDPFGATGNVEVDLLTVDGSGCWN